MAWCRWCMRPLGRVGGVLASAGTPFDWPRPPSHTAPGTHQCGTLACVKHTTTTQVCAAEPGECARALRPLHERLAQVACVASRKPHTHAAVHCSGASCVCWAGLLPAPLPLSLVQVQARSCLHCGVVRCGCSRVPSRSLHAAARPGVARTAMLSIVQGSIHSQAHQPFPWPIAGWISQGRFGHLAGLSRTCSTTQFSQGNG